MSDNLLIQSIIDRQAKVEEKLDRLVDAVHEIAINERDQTQKIDALKIQMEAISAKVEAVAKNCTNCAPHSEAPDDATEVSQGIAAGVRLAMKNPRYLWAVILAGMSMTLGANWSDIVRTLVQLVVPGAGVSPQ